MIFYVGKMSLSNNIVDDSNLLFVFWANFPNFIVDSAVLTQGQLPGAPRSQGPMLIYVCQVVYIMFFFLIVNHSGIFR